MHEIYTLSQLFIVHMLPSWFLRLASETRVFRQQFLERLDRRGVDNILRQNVVDLSNAENRSVEIICATDLLHKLFAVSAGVVPGARRPSTHLSREDLCKIRMRVSKLDLMKQAKRPNIPLSACELVVDGWRLWNARLQRRAHEGSTSTNV